MLTSRSRGRRARNREWTELRLGEATASLDPPVRPPAPALPPFTIAAPVDIVGAVHYPAAVSLAGNVSGEIRCRSLAVLEDASADGLIVADQVTVSGRFVGAIFAGKLVLTPTSHVEGEICCTSLVLERGSYFEGKSRKHQAPLTMAPPSDDI